MHDSCQPRRSPFAGMGLRLPLPVVPPGDLLVLFPWLAARFSRACRTYRDSIVIFRRRRRPWGKMVTVAISRGIVLSRHPEEALRQGPVFGILKLVLVGLLIGLLAFP